MSEPKLSTSAWADHAVGEDEGVERAGVERGLDDAGAALVDVARNHEQIATGRGQRADFGRVVGAAVFMGCDERDGAAHFLEGRGEAVGETLAVVVVGVGHGHGVECRAP
jgi:hypothetical protein